MSSIKNKYIVGSQDSTGSVSFSSRPMLHSNESDANQEAERLALANPNKSFIVAKVTGKVSANRAVWA